MRRHFATTNCNFLLDFINYKELNKLWYQLPNIKTQPFCLFVSLSTSFEISQSGWIWPKISLILLWIDWKNSPDAIHRRCPSICETASSASFVVDRIVKAISKISRSFFVLPLRLSPWQGSVFKQRTLWGP